MSENVLLVGQAILAVPNKLIISEDKVTDSEIAQVLER